MGVFPVILCGGAGTRLWPLSRPSRPKQFASLIAERSLFELTVARAAGIAGFTSLVVVTSESQGEWVSRQLEVMGVPADILLEPVGRDSAPAMAAAAVQIAAQDASGIAVVLASDHFIPDEEGFQRAIATGIETAKKGRIVTLGVRPTFANTAYGYIQPAAAAAGEEVPPVAAFVEKPDQSTAERYVAGGYLWNSGNFIASCATLLGELAAHAPQVKLHAEKAIAGATVTRHGIRLGEAFAQAPKISIDYAVMEKTAIASVLPVDFYWSDLGAWDALFDILPKDDSGNATLGENLLHETKRSLAVTAPGMLTAIIGLENVAVVTEHDSVLVCRLDKSQSVKTVVERLRTEGRPQSDFPTTAAAPSTGRPPEALKPWLMTAALPLWWAVGADPDWGFHESLDAEGRPTDEARRCRVQARQAYVYATAGQMGWAGPWETAVEHGLAALAEKYRRPDGLFRTLVAPDGAILDDRAMTYDQAFILLALAAARTIRPDAEEMAVALLKVITDTRTAPAGGFREEGVNAYLSNPHMHLFEAALAWMEAGGGPKWQALAYDIARLALAKLYDPAGGFIREYYNEDWTPAAGELGHVIDTGHQFEWAKLLERWARHTGDRDASQVARHLYAAGRRGIDAARGAAVDELTDDFAVRKSQARLWPQTEWLSAALLFSEQASGAWKDLVTSDIAASARALWHYLDDEQPGLWRDKLQKDGMFNSEPSPASSLYHIVAAAKQIEDSAAALSAAGSKGRTKA